MKTHVTEMCDLQEIVDPPLKNSRNKGEFQTRTAALLKKISFHAVISVPGTEYYSSNGVCRSK